MNTHPYPPDLTNEEWAIFAPLITLGEQPGHPQVLELRHIVDTMLYLVRTECQWRALPHDFPSWPSVFYHYAKWRCQPPDPARLAAARRQRDPRRRH